MATLWGGRFEGGLNDVAQRLSFSLAFDRRLVRYDIRVNQAHCQALTKAGILTADELATITDCLTTLDDQIQADPNRCQGPDEDVHSFVERFVTEQCGDLGKKMHAGKSRNDQVMTDMRLYLKDAILEIQDQLKHLVSALLKKAENHIDVVVPGMTHFQPAQPVLLSHHLCAYIHGFLRDIDRLSHTLIDVDVCPLGSGAMAGNNYELDRALIADQLGFSAVSKNSMDAVADRDFLCAFLSDLSIVMMHLSRFAEECVLWSSPLLGFMVIGDDFTTGSSIMPQKKNPDMAELIRGKSGRVIGHMMSLHHIIKALPLTYNRDLQEDKELSFDSIDTVLDCVECMAQMIESIEYQHDDIEQALQKGYLCATECADYLVKKGVPFRQAHDVTGQIVLKAVAEKRALESLSLSEFKEICQDIDEDIYEALTIDAAINAKNVPGGTATGPVMAQITQIKEERSWIKH